MNICKWLWTWFFSVNVVWCLLLCDKYLNKQKVLQNYHRDTSTIRKAQFWGTFWTLAAILNLCKWVCTSLFFNYCCLMSYLEYKMPKWSDYSAKVSQRHMFCWQCQILAAILEFWTLTAVGDSQNCFKNSEKKSHNISTPKEPQST